MSGFAAGRVALITGSSRGIGRALAVKLAGEGASVVINFKRNADLADEAVAAVEEAGGRAIAVQADMEDPAEIERLFAACAEEYGRLDYYVGNAAAAAFKSIEELKLHHMDRTYAMNVRAFVLGAQHAVPLMRDGGRIVVLSSYGSIRAYPTYAALGAAKAALEAYVRYMAVEFGPRGIHVNCVSPGPVETDLWLGDKGVAATVGGAAGIDPAAVREQTAAGIATRRFSTPQEVATLVALLASPRTANVTGANYVIDGGLVKTM